jgi:hypothetical protein
LDVDRSGTASFTADLNMETSDYGITGATQVDPNNPSTRDQHTHHISITNAKVSYDTSVCPVFNPPTTGSGVVITGTAATSGNGGPAPFESKGASTLQVCVTGGSEVEFANLTMYTPDQPPRISVRSRSTASSTWHRQDRLGRPELLSKGLADSTLMCHAVHKLAQLKELYQAAQGLSQEE